MSFLFGTDGIRGIVNQFPIDPLSFVKIAQSIGLYLQQEYPGQSIKCVIGKDTRESGYMIECALVSGLVSLGIEIYLVGPMPTPAVAFLTRSMRCSAGIMISASHNPFHDNGIKVFEADGTKLSTKAITFIEDCFQHMPTFAVTHHVGKVKRIDDAVGRYIEYIKSYFPANFSLQGYRIVIDCANGAAYKIAPIILEELGAEVITYGIHPDGRNINADCGSLHPDGLSAWVKEHKADIGIALDGDADRIVLVDEKGAIVSGECLLGFLGVHLNTSKKIVTTQVSNPALEDFLTSQGIETILTDVGDSHVYAAMRAQDAYVGGEPSGHILFGTDVCASDGLLTALQCVALLRNIKKPVSAITQLFPLMPFKTINIPIKHDLFQTIDAPSIAAKLALSSRFLVRKSGTETVVRVYLWNHDEAALEKDLQSLISVLGQKLK
ncbi:MAG: phosphoglucosamine mutase [Pseudomonadota bacterium]